MAGLDPAVAAILDGMAQREVAPMWELTPVEARAMAEQGVALMSRFAPVVELASVVDTTIEGSEAQLAVRVYTPTGDPPDAGRAGVVYFHGGGYVICSVETHDALCRTLAARSGSVVVSVDYRLAPEHPWPAGVTDAYDALCWLAERGAELGVDPNRLVVAGDSAGANLAAVTALQARDRDGPPLAGQVLAYPGTDRVDTHPSSEEFGEGYLLDHRMREWFVQHYLPEGTDVADPRVSPLRASSHAGLAPALVITAAFDPLRDEGEAYGAALAEAGVSTTVVRYQGMIHGFLSYLGIVAAADTAVDQIAGWVRRMGGS